MEDEIDKGLVPIFSNELDKRLRFELFAEFEGGQSVLGEGVVKVVDGFVMIEVGC
jgi:hypothetical protein